MIGVRHRLDRADVAAGPAAGTISSHLRLVAASDARS